MKITTSRDPSAKARRLGRLLARFLSIPYITRGKQGLNEEEKWLVVIEHHGNPAGLIKRFEGRTETLAFAAITDINAESMRQKGVHPVVTGTMDEAIKIAGFFELEWLESPPADTATARSIKVASGQIDFVDEGETAFRLKI